MRFSVIVPVYDSEKYLRECIDSVLNQTCADFELILVDDGSTDSSGDICDAAAESDGRIRVFHQEENGGQFRARCKGITEAEGDYVVPLDSDDVLRRDALDVIASYIDSSNADMVIFKCSRSPSFDPPFADYGLKDAEVYADDGKKTVYGILAESTKLNSFCLKAYARTLLLGVKWDADFISTLRHGEDLMQLLPVVTTAKSIVFCDQTLYYYRPNADGTANKYSPEYYNMRRAVFECSAVYLRIWGIGATHYNKLKQKLLRGIVTIVKSLAAEERDYCISELERIGSDPWGGEIYLTTDLYGLPRKYKLILRLLYKKHPRILRFMLLRAK